MRLADAVRGASTPEALAVVLEEIGRRYLAARREEKKFTLAKGEIRNACVAALKRLETDVYEWVLGGKKFRARVYQVARVKPTQALVDLLASRGLGHLVTTAVSIDDAGLFREVRRGTVGIDEIRVFSEISRSEGFTINEVKAKENEAPEE